MISLLLDSSSSNLTVGIALNNEIKVRSSYFAWQRQSELMIPEIVKVLKSNGISFNDLSSVIVAIGPGSYTGVRIAISIAKVIAFSLKIEIYGVSSLEIMKIASKETICLINARSGRSYVGIYRDDTTLVTDTIWTNNEVFEYIKTHPETAISGDVTYLGLTSETSDILATMLKEKNPSHLIKNVHSVKPVYLKD